MTVPTDFKSEVSAIRTTLQDLIARSERDLGSDNEFVSALRSADDNLSEAEDYDFEADTDDDDNEGSEE